MRIDFKTSRSKHNHKPVEALIRVFKRQIVQERLHNAAQLVVLHQGKVIADLAHGGMQRNRPVTSATPFFTFSVSKAFTGVCIHHLIEAGEIDMDSPVSAYWPEFGQKGKETATIRHVFLHQAGIPAPRLNQQVFLWPFWQLVTRHVARTPAVYPPGTKTAYHLVNYGFIFGEIVRRVSGLSIDRYLEKHFIKPLGLKSTWMRMPADKIGDSPRLFSGDKAYNTAVFVFNRRIYRRALMPAATLHSSARDLAIFYQMLLNGGSYDGHQYLRPETVRQATSVGYEGQDHLHQHPMRWAYGFHLNQSEVNEQGETINDMGYGASNNAFGHFGMASCIAFADPENELVFTFTCNRLIKNSGTRNQALLNALWDIFN